MIDYRIEFLPAAVVTFAVAAPIGLLLLVGLLRLAHQSLWVLWPAIPLSGLVIGANWWTSERQAHWLVDFIRHQLEAI